MPDTALRQHLIAAMRGGQAFDTFDDIVAEIPADKRFVVPPGAERSAWQILEHMRIALDDIVDFSSNEDGSYQERNWPDEYWPKTAAPEDPEGWSRTIAGYKLARSRMESLVMDESKDLFTPFPWGDGQTLLREAILVIDHDAHHLGQLIELSRWLNAT